VSFLFSRRVYSIQHLDRCSFELWSLGWSILLGLGLLNFVLVSVRIVLILVISGFDDMCFLKWDRRMVLCLFFLCFVCW